MENIGQAWISISHTTSIKGRARGYGGRCCDATRSQLSRCRQKHTMKSRYTERKWCTIKYRKNNRQKNFPWTEQLERSNSHKVLSWFERTSLYFLTVQSLSKHLTHREIAISGIPLTSSVAIAMQKSAINFATFLSSLGSVNAMRCWRGSGATGIEGHV